MRTCARAARRVSGVAWVRNHALVVVRPTRACSLPLSLPLPLSLSLARLRVRAVREGSEILQLCGGLLELGAQGLLVQEALLELALQSHHLRRQLLSLRRELLPHPRQLVDHLEITRARR